MTQIKIKNLSKSYNLGLISSRTLINDLERLSKGILNSKKSKSIIINENKLTSNENVEKIWALKNINLKVNKGEIISYTRDGAGNEQVQIQIDAPPLENTTFYFALINNELVSDKSILDALSDVNIIQGPERNVVPPTLRMLTENKLRLMMYNISTTHDRDEAYCHIFWDVLEQFWFVAINQSKLQLA